MLVMRDVSHGVFYLQSKLKIISSRPIFYFFDVELLTSIEKLVITHCGHIELKILILAVTQKIKFHIFPRRRNPSVSNPCCWLLDKTVVIPTNLNNPESPSNFSKVIKFAHVFCGEISMYQVEQNFPLMENIYISVGRKSFFSFL